MSEHDPEQALLESLVDCIWELRIDDYNDVSPWEVAGKQLALFKAHYGITDAEFPNVITATVMPADYQRSAN